MRLTAARSCRPFLVRSCAWSLAIVLSSGWTGAQANEWKVEAIVELGDDVPDATFLKTGGSSQDVTFSAASAGGYSTVIDFQSVVHSDPSNGLLQARSSATIDMPGWLDVKALGKAKAILDDVITVEPVQGWQQVTGIIRLVWSLDGKLFTDTFSPDNSPLTFYTGSGAPNPVWSFGYYVEVEMRAKYLDLAQQQQDVDFYKNYVYFARGVNEISNAAKDFNEFIDRPDLARANFGEGVTGVGDDLAINEQGSLNIAIPAPANTPIPVSFELVTGFNARFHNEDYGALRGSYLSLFENTAKLEGVRLYEAGGTPYFGDAIITSQNGIDYKILPVPEVPTPLLVTVAFAGVWMIRRGRKADVLAR
jgi:hypothetical protein